MTIPILLAILNGMLIGSARALNGRLSVDRGPLTASLWNHAVGCLLLTAMLLGGGGWKFAAAAAAPWSAYLGGVIGAVYVAINSYVFARLGATDAALLIISGQMTAAVLLDFARGSERPTAARWLGVVLVLLGIYMTKVSRTRGSLMKTAKLAVEAA